MNQRLRILFVTAEVTPFARTGGLGDVCGALSHTLASLGHDVRIVMPLYKAIRDRNIAMQVVVEDVEMPLVFGTRKTRVWQGYLGEKRESEDQPAGVRVPVYFIEQDEYFARPGLYGGEAGDYSDNALRFIFLCRAVLALPEHIAWFPHIFHCHDWHTALLPAYLRSLPDLDDRLTAAGTVFTIHNLAYQGRFPSWVFDITGLPHTLFQTKGIEFHGEVNFMKAGLYYADHLTTVSPTYAWEICTPEGGFGLDGVLRERRQVLTGILNGVDYKGWNPATDPLISARYTVSDLRGKAACKRELLRRFELPHDPSTPVAAVISRLTEQKGIDLVAAALPQLLALPIRLVILASGEPYYERLCLEWTRRYPELVGVQLGFDDVLAHQIQAGADLLLMPSRYEPCGLTQLYSQRYGTIPVVRAVGGLRDTVIPFDRTSGQGTGFTFTEPTAAALVESVREATTVFSDQPVWSRLIQNAMQQEFSWTRSAGLYVGLYRHVSTQRGEEVPGPISFDTAGWRGLVAEDFTHERVAAVARAIADHVADEDGNRPHFLIAHDTRFLGREFAETAAQACATAGVHMSFATIPLPTPVVAFEILRRRLSGAINVTASRNPYRWNGIKFSPAWGGPVLLETTQDIARRANAWLANGYVERMSLEQARRAGHVVDENIGEEYRNAIEQLIDVECIRQSEVTIAVDLLWGTASGFLDCLLKRWGVLGPVFHQGHDPYFGYGRPEPAPEAMEELITRLQRGGVTLGVSCDCDAGRFGICDTDGTFFTPNLMLPLLADYLVTYRQLTGKIGRSIATSHLVDAVAQHHGLDVVETPVGFTYLGELIRRGELLLGGEESGGLSIRGHIPEKDGILACLLVVEMVARTGKTLAVLLHELFERVGARFPLRNDVPVSAAQQAHLQAALAAPPSELAGLRVEHVESHDGVKLYLNGGRWLLVRVSSTEPVVRLYAEAEREETTVRLLTDAKQVFLA
ncbi:MAG: glycogen synthase GlgA [Candidatus Binatia bacterium]